MSFSTIATTSQTLWRVIESYGLDPVPVFREAGLDPDAWHSPGARFDEDRLDRAWAIATEASGDPCIGLRVARFFNPASLQALGFAWLTSECLLDALSRLVRYFRAVSNALQLELSLSGDQCVIAVDRALYRRQAHDQTRDALWAALISLCRVSTSDDFCPLSLDLERPRPACAADFYALFRAEVNFDAGQDRMRLGRSQVERPLPTANRELALRNERAVADYMATLDRNRFSDRVRLSLIERLPGGEVEAGSIARALNVSLRTLQRRLTEEGTCYTGVLDEARRELALAYIGEQQMPIKEATYVLGFSDPANFTRAFRRWTGQTPTEYRESA